VRAGLVRADRVEGLAVLRHVDAAREDLHHPALVGVEDELLVPHGQPALEPAARKDFEADWIRRALRVSGGNRTHAARLLEISHRSLLYKLKEFGIAD
jgi:DNA-binding NtrC family response regulator